MWSNSVIDGIFLGRDNNVLCKTTPQAGTY